MSKEDEALVMLAGIRPTKKNTIVSLGREMVDQYKKPQPEPSKNYFAALTPLQKKMLEQSVITV